MRICDRCQNPDQVYSCVSTGVTSRTDNDYPFVKIVNIDLCKGCVLDLRELIRKFLTPINTMVVTKNDGSKDTAYHDGFEDVTLPSGVD